MSLFMRYVMTCIMLHLPVSFWLETAYKTCCTDIGSFLPMMRIQRLVMFLYANVWLNGLLFVDWEIYEMLWCSKYCVTMPMGLPLGGKFILTSKISYLMKGLYARSILLLEGRSYFCQLEFQNMVTILCQIYCYAHKILQMNNIWVSWCVGTTIFIVNILFV